MTNRDSAEGISVIIPTYNRAPFLREALRSVMSQKYPANEIIVIDDGSTDKTASLVEEIKKTISIPIIYRTQPRRGPAAARNSGILASRFQYVSFLDSDDCWHPDKLSHQYDAMRTQPNWLISHTCEKWFRNGSHLNQKKIHKPPMGDIFFRSAELCCVGMSTVMAKKELFHRFGLFDETLQCCEDYDMWLRVSGWEPFLLVDEALTIKNGGRDDQVSRIYRSGMDRFRIQSLAKIVWSRSLANTRLTPVVRELVRKCTIYANGCAKRGRITESDHYRMISDQAVELVRE